MCGITASIAIKPETHKSDGTARLYISSTEEISGDLAREKHESLRNTLQDQIQASIDTLNHRGPDGSGIWISENNNVALGHCRLTINDLSPSGSQPLHSDNGSIHAVVNGEIYDFDRLRQECSTNFGYTLSSESDSELVLALYKIHGVPGMFEYLRGELSFVLYDNRPGINKLIAARDRYGIKPLVYTLSAGRLLFAAEAKAFLPLDWSPEWDVASIVDGGCMVDERTLFKGVKKLLPGHYLMMSGTRDLQTHRYWDTEYEDNNKVETRNLDDMITGVRERLVESIRLRMRADVPIGVYLSGGIDSSAVAGIVTDLAKKENVKIGSQAATRVACFSLCFPRESGYDESDIADRTANWLGVETLKREVTEHTLARDFADTAYHCEHHNSNMNSVAKFALSTLPQEHGFKVVITGEGSDEHFSGYPFLLPDYLRDADMAMPESPLASDSQLRSSLQSTIQAELRKIYLQMGGTLQTTPPKDPLFHHAEDFWMSEQLLMFHSTSALFAPWVREQYPNVDGRDIIASSHGPEIRDKMKHKWHSLHSAQYIWNKSHLANMILTCLGDRTEMAHSIEARTPFLDHHLTEYLDKLPPSVKLAYVPPPEENQRDFLWRNVSKELRSLTEKWILREAVRPYISDELYKRKKHPFLAPTKWPEGGPLQQSFTALLSREAVENLGFVRYERVEEALSRAFGDGAEPKAFRTLLHVGAWVVLADRFGIPKAECLYLPQKTC